MEMGTPVSVCVRVCLVEVFENLSVSYLVRPVATGRWRRDGSGGFLPLVSCPRKSAIIENGCREVKHVDERDWIPLWCFLSPCMHLIRALFLSPPPFSIQAVCSSETLIRSTRPFVWRSSCTTPARTPRRRPSTWCLTWTTSRRPTASPSPTPVSRSRAVRVVFMCFFGVFSYSEPRKTKIPVQQSLERDLSKQPCVTTWVTRSESFWSVITSLYPQS